MLDNYKEDLETPGPGHYNIMRSFSKNVNEGLEKSTNGSGKINIPSQL